MKRYLFLLVITFSVIKCLSFNIEYSNECLQILTNHSYTVGYSFKHNQAIWCMYELTRDQLLSTNKVHRSDDFRNDPNIKIDLLYSYKKSGFDKGHLCPAQDRSYNAVDMSETFLMSNMSPQEPSFNRGEWKRLETYTRNYAIDHTNITVITGPIFFNRYQTLTNNVSIPHMYYKILIDNSNTNSECYLLPNQKCEHGFDSYKVTISYIECLSGIKVEL